MEVSSHLNILRSASLAAAAAAIANGASSVPRSGDSDASDVPELAQSQSQQIVTSHTQLPPNSIQMSSYPALSDLLSFPTGPPSSNASSVGTTSLEFAAAAAVVAAGSSPSPYIHHQAIMLPHSHQLQCHLFAPSLLQSACQSCSYCSPSQPCPLHTALQPPYSFAVAAGSQPRHPYLLATPRNVATTTLVYSNQPGPNPSSLRLSSSNSSAASISASATPDSTQQLFSSTGSDSQTPPSPSASISSLPSIESAPACTLHPATNRSHPHSDQEYSSVTTGRNGGGGTQQILSEQAQRRLERGAAAGLDPFPISLLPPLQLTSGALPPTLPHLGFRSHTMRMKRSQPTPQSRMDAAVAVANAALNRQHRGPYTSGMNYREQIHARNSLMRGNTSSSGDSPRPAKLRRVASAVGVRDVIMSQTIAEQQNRDEELDQLFGQSDLGLRSAAVSVRLPSPISAVATSSSELDAPLSSSTPEGPMHPYYPPFECLSSPSSSVSSTIPSSSQSVQTILPSHGSSSSSGYATTSNQAVSSTGGVSHPPQQIQASAAAQLCLTCPPCPCVYCPHQQLNAVGVGHSMQQQPTNPPAASSLLSAATQQQSQQHQNGTPASAAVAAAAAVAAMQHPTTHQLHAAATSAVNGAQSSAMSAIVSAQQQQQAMLQSLQYLQQLQAALQNAQAPFVPSHLFAANSALSNAVNQSITNHATLVAATSTAATMAQQLNAGVAHSVPSTNAAEAAIAAYMPLDNLQRILHQQSLPRVPFFMMPSRPVTLNSSGSTRQMVEMNLLVNIVNPDMLHLGMERQVLDRHHMFAAANAGAPLTEPPPIGATLCDIEMGSTTKQFILTTEVSEEERERCTVCFEAFETGETVRELHCAHSFHVPCIDKWLVQNKKCPLCRVDVDRDAAKLSAKRQQTVTTSAAAWAHHLAAEEEQRPNAF